MAGEFGIIDLPPDGGITYTPPVALVTNFRTFKNGEDRLVSVMEVIPQEVARPSIENLRTTLERPGAVRNILTATVGGTPVKIPNYTTVFMEIPDNSAMHIPFFNYADKSKYFQLLNQEKPLREVLERSVKLDRLRNLASTRIVPASITDRSFSIASDHPSVSFPENRQASFSGFFTAPIHGTNHAVALHGFLKEPVKIAIRSGFNSRTETLPVGFEMIIPLNSGKINFTDGRPNHWTRSPAGYIQITPPPPSEGPGPVIPEGPVIPDMPLAPTGPIDTGPVIPDMPLAPTGPIDTGPVIPDMPLAPTGPIATPTVLRILENARAARAAAAPPIDVDPSTNTLNIKDLLSISGVKSPTEAATGFVEKPPASPRAIWFEQQPSITNELTGATMRGQIGLNFTNDIYNAIQNHIFKIVKRRNLRSEFLNFKDLNDGLNRIQTTYLGNKYVFKLPSGKIPDFTDIDGSDIGKHNQIILQFGNIRFAFQLELYSSESVKIISVAETKPFRMPPNENMDKYTLINDIIAVANTNPFRMDPNIGFSGISKIK
jgi:hypothetical protein